MVDNRFQRHSADFHPEPKIGRIFLVSLGLHLLVVLIFSGTFSQHSSPPKRPVYYVDLTQLPVANPRAGRPDGQSGTPKKVKKAAPKAPAATKKVTKTVKKAAPAAPAKKTAKRNTVNAAKKAPVAKKTTKTQAAAKSAATSKKSSAASEADYQAAMSTVDKIRRKREMAALKDKLAALASADSRPGSAASGGSSAPLGMPDGTGDQAGVSQELWLQERLKKNWSLSKYQVIRRDIEARVRITYDADGHLTGKQFLKPSGDNTFDDSITRAILKSRQLEFKPGRKLEVVVIFNLKELMD